MNLFRALLIILTIVIFGTTIPIMSAHGVDFITPYFTALFSGTWQGQFNLDFGMYLGLTGLWVMWRGGFAGPAIAAGLVVGLLGMLVFAPYVLWLTFKEEGDIQRILLGVHATSDA